MHRKTDTRLLARNLPLHDDGCREEIDAESLLQPVTDGPRGVARGPASLDRCDDFLLLDDVEVGRLLPREARAPGVLYRRRAPHGHRDLLPLPRPLAELRVRGGHFFEDGFRDSRRLDYQPDHVRVSIELLRVVD